MTAAIIEPFRPADEWPLPDARLLNGGVRPAPALPLEAFGSLGKFIADLGAAKGGPPDYAALSLLTAAAGVIGDARAVQMRRNWIEPCILWGALVGNPSTGKTQPIDVMKRAVKAIEPDDAPDFEARHSAWKTASGIAKEIENVWQRKVRVAVQKSNPPPAKPADLECKDEPLRPRILIGSVTVEKLGLLFAAFPRGLLLMIDEGAGWLGNLGKYGGDGDASFFLSAYSGVGTTVDRVKEGGSVSPDRALLSACVGIQPERLNELLFKRADDGLLSRFLLAWPDAVPAVWETPIVDEQTVTHLFRRLRSLRAGIDEDGRPSPVLLLLSAEAEALYRTWYVAAKTKAQAANGLRAGFLGKGLGVVGRLALVLELLAWATSDAKEPANISGTCMARAILLFSDYFAPMADRVYGDADRPPAERNAATLLAAIRERRVRRLNKREIYRHWGLNGLRDAKMVQAALDILETGDCLRDVSTSTEVGGRRRGDYAVSPHVLGP